MLQCAGLMHLSGANVAIQVPAGVESVTPPVRALAGVVVAIAAVTLVGYVVPLGFAAIGYIYLFTVIALSLCVGRWLALVAAVLSALAWDYAFVPPRLSFLILHFDDVLVLGTYSVTALVASQLIVRIRALQREREQLLTASERLHRTLLDSVSHELKTPLAVLRSATDKLVDDDPARRILLMTEIRAATLRLDQLVTNLLDETRLESGALRPHLDWCDAHDLIAVARRDVAEALEGRTLRVDIPADLPLFRADATLLEQALANLMLNAVRHTPPECFIRVAAGVERGRLYISVADNGPGLPPEIAADPFRRFRRGPDAPTGGIGLGLSIVRGFVVAQGGEITATSSREGGACFTVYLPLTSPVGVPDDGR
jgi:K+-sensing histidine kinase KdpD